MHAALQVSYTVSRKSDRSSVIAHLLAEIPLCILVNSVFPKRSGHRF